MDWWAKFDLWEFLIHPMKYGVPAIDAWIREWGTFVDAFVAANPWFCTFMSGTGMSWFTWFVMKTPWKWDDSWPKKLKDWWINRKSPPIGAEKNPHVLVDEIKEEVQK